MDVAKALSRKLDKSMATLVISEDGARHLIAEAILTGVALYLLKKYADGFLKGLGMEDMAVAHGKKTKEFLQALRQGESRPGQVEEIREDLESEIAILHGHKDNATAADAALLGVVAVFIEAGAVRSQAQAEAEKVRLAFAGRMR